MSGEGERETDLTRVESVIMAVVNAGHRTTRDIYDALPEISRKRLAFTTIATYLMRMVQKGYLTRTPTAGREFEYHPNIDIDKLVDQICSRASDAGVKDSAMLRRFAGNEKIDREIQDQLRSLARQLEEMGQ